MANEVAIVAILVILLVAVGGFAFMYRDNLFGTGMVVVETPQQNTVVNNTVIQQNTTVREENTIIQPVIERETIRERTIIVNNNSNTT